MQHLSLIVLLLSVTLQQLNAQCTPPMSDNCDDSRDHRLCSLAELNGYSCSNLSTIPSPCSPICSQGGVGNNTSWWAFVNKAGSVSITLTVGSCANNQGLEFGIWGNCSCGDEIVCRSNPCTNPGTSKSVNVNLVACKTYYLWVDGCNGDVCDFTINTTGGGPPVLPPLGKINNKANMIIEPVCPGARQFLFHVEPPSGGYCYPTYEWTLDGVLVGSEGPEIEIDMPNFETDLIICVTAKFKNVPGGTTCAEQGPQCATVKVRNASDLYGLPRTLCYEQTKSGGFKWHSKYITSSGIYHQQFSLGHNCYYDSIVDFTVLEAPYKESVYFISCDNKPFIDITGKKHPLCLNKSEVVLSKITEPFKCDSAIVLTAINVDFAPSWSTQCKGGMVELIPNVNILKPCNAGETYEFEYKWYKKSKPGNILSSDERLLVQSVSEDYCLEVKVVTQIESEIAVCTRIFCEEFNEGNLAPECAFKLVDNNVFCFDPFVVYRIDSLFVQKVNFYTWTVDGGQIVSKADSSVVEVKWSFNPNDSGKICATYNTDCGTSCEKCLTIKFQTKIAGEDFEHRGLSAYLDTKPNPNGMWRLISGPYPVRIEDPTFARTKITATNYGYYCFEWTVTAPNCTMKDTLCVNLHNFKKASPEYPKLLFFERAGSNEGKVQSSEFIFTPNLIQNNGESFVNIEGDIKSKMNYHWFDIYGRAITHDEMNVEFGIQRITIHSPMNVGMYFLVIQLNGMTTVRKVCVIE